jgi:transcriptional regulator with XRE-family HTH domain
MTKTLVEQYVANPSNMRLFQQERAIFEITELLEETMKQQGVSRAELARRLGRSKGWVTQLLDAEANKTVRTVADAFAVLGREFRAQASPISLGKEKPSGLILKGIRWSSVIADITWPAQSYGTDVIVYGITGSANYEDDFWGSVWPNAGTSALVAR